VRLVIGLGFVGLAPLVQAVEGRAELPAGLLETVSEDQYIQRLGCVLVDQPPASRERLVEEGAHFADPLSGLLAGVLPVAALWRLGQLDRLSAANCGEAPSTRLVDCPAVNAAHSAAVQQGFAGEAFELGAQVAGRPGLCW
jgi:hypothetical protein